MLPFIKDLSARLGQLVEQELHDRGFDLTVDGTFCPACHEEMKASMYVVSPSTRLGADLALCQKCASALFAQRRIYAVHDIASLPLKERIAICFQGKVPDSWLQNYQKLSGRS